MAVRFHLVLVLGVLVFLCLSSQVCSNSNGYSEEEGIKMAMDGEVVRGSGPNRRLMQNIDCGWQCKRRCGAHSRPNRCIRACGTCCARCKCVPPGTSGNRDICGTCYTNMTTHANKTKCP